MLEGGSITKCLQINQVKLPQTKIINTYKRILKVTSYYTINKRYNNVQRYKKCKCSQFAKHAPIALTLLDRLHWPPQKALKNQRK